MFVTQYLHVRINQTREKKYLVVSARDTAPHCALLGRPACLTLCDPMDIVHKAPWSMAFSRQEFCRGLPFPSPGDLPDPGINPASLSVSCIGRQILDHQRHLGSTSLN